MPPVSRAEPPLPGSGPKRKLSPAWAGLGFVLLLMGGFAASQIYNYSVGPKFKWFHDYDAALAEAGRTNRRIFLYLHEPNCPVTVDLDRGLFTRRVTREVLAQMVPCRLELGRTDPLRAKFKFETSPTWMVLTPAGERVTDPHTGGLDERTFQTYVRAK